MRETLCGMKQEAEMKTWMRRMVLMVVLLPAVGLAQQKPAEAPPAADIGQVRLGRAETCRGPETQSAG